MTLYCEKVPIEPGSEKKDINPTIVVGILFLIFMLACAYFVQTAGATTCTNITLTETKGVSESNIILKYLHLYGMNGTNVSSETRIYDDGNGLGNRLRTQVTGYNSTDLFVHVYVNFTIAAGASKNISTCWDSGLSDPAYPKLIWCDDNFTTGTATGNCGWQANQTSGQLMNVTNGELVLNGGAGSTGTNATTPGALGFSSGICASVRRGTGTTNDYGVGINRKNASWYNIISTAGDTTKIYYTDGVGVGSYITKSTDYTNGERICIFMNGTGTNQVRLTETESVDNTSVLTSVSSGTALTPSRSLGAAFIYGQSAATWYWDNITVFNESEVNDYGKDLAYVFYAPVAGGASSVPIPTWVTPSSNATAVSVKYQFMNWTDASTVSSGIMEWCNTSCTNFTATCTGKYCYLNMSQTANLTYVVARGWITNGSGTNTTKDMYINFSNLQTPINPCSYVSLINAGQNSKIIVNGSGINYTFTSISSCLAENQSLLNYGNGVWLLNANLSVLNNSFLLWNNTDVTYLRINSTVPFMHNITLRGANAWIYNTKATAWNTITNKIATGSYGAGTPRSYILIFDTILPFEIHNSNMSYMGYGVLGDDASPEMGLYVQNSTMHMDNMSFTDSRTGILAYLLNNSWISNSTGNMLMGDMIAVVNSSNVLIYNNTLTTCGIGGDAWGLEIVNCNDTVIQKNVVTGCTYAMGYESNWIDSAYMDSNLHPVIFRDNIIHDNTYGYTFGWGQNGTIVINNTAYNNQQNVYFITNSNLHTDNMIFLNNSFQNATGNNVWVNSNNYMSNITFFNNIISGATSYNINNGDPITLNATYNDWGLYTNASIAAKLNGAVTYYPFLGVSSDTTPPSILWGNPSNGTFTSNQSWIWWNSSLNETPNVCLLAVNASANISMTIDGSNCYYNSTSLTNQTTYCGLIWANDSTGNMNVSSVQCATINLSQSPAGPTCGDGSCNGAEDCSSCSADCGSCGGGGTLPTPYWDASVPANGSTVTTKYQFLKWLDYSNVNSGRIQWCNPTCSYYTASCTSNYCTYNVTQTVNITYAIFRGFLSNASGENVSDDRYLNFSIQYPPTQSTFEVVPYDETALTRIYNYTAIFITNVGSKSFGVNTTYVNGNAPGVSAVNSANTYDANGNTYGTFYGGNDSLQGNIYYGDSSQLCYRFNQTTADSYVYVWVTYPNASMAVIGYVHKSGDQAVQDVCYPLNSAIVNDMLTVNVTVESDYGGGRFYLYEVYPDVYNITNRTVSINSSWLIAGSNRIDISDPQSLYYGRTYYTTIGMDNVTYNVYLPAKTETIVNPVFYVINSMESPVNGATVTIQKNIAGTYTTIAQGITDMTGTFTTPLIYNKPYRVSASLNGYTTAIDINQIQQADYQITLNSTLSINFTNIQQDVTTSVTPYFVRVNSTATSMVVPFNFTINSSDNRLTMYGMRLLCNNSVVYMTNITGNSGGGSLVYNLDVVPCSNVTLDYYYTTDAGISYRFVFYDIQKASSYGLAKAFETLVGNTDATTQIIVAILFFILIGSVFAFFPEGSVIMELIIGGMFVYYGILASGIYIVASISVFSLMLIKRRWF